MTKHIIEFDKKMEMFLKSAPVIEHYLQQSLANESLSNFEKIKIEDALNSITNIKNRQEIQYSDAFFYSFALAKEFYILSEQVRNNNISIEKMKDEQYWDEGDIDFTIALFFSYSFVNELFGKNIGIDMHKIMNSNNIESSYTNFRDTLKNNN